MKKHKFIIEVEIPDKMNITMMKKYLKNIIRNKIKKDVVFSIKVDSINVVHATRAKVADLLMELKG